MTEKSVSFVQCILSLHFKNSKDNNLTASLRGMSVFWESASPRFGELGFDIAATKITRRSTNGTDCKYPVISHFKKCFR